MCFIHDFPTLRSPWSEIIVDKCSLLWSLMLCTKFCQIHHNLSMNFQHQLLHLLLWCLTFLSAVITSHWLQSIKRYFHFSSSVTCSACSPFAPSIVCAMPVILTLKVLNFLKYSYKWGGWTSDSCCSLKPLWSGMGEVVPARTSPTLHPPSPPTVL